MKKSVVILFTMFLFLILPNLSLAIETNIKQNYRPAETMILEIDATFLKPVTTDSIFLYSGRDYISTVYNVAKIGTKTHIYLLLPLKEGDYTLVIEDANYFEKGHELTKDLEFNFSISGEIVLFTVKPGFIIANDDFKITIQSQVREITVTGDFLGVSVQESVPAGVSEKMNFLTSHVNESTTTTLKVSSGDTSYSLPVVIIKQIECGNNLCESGEDSSNCNEDCKDNVTISENITKIRFSRSTVNRTITSGVKDFYNLTIINPGQEDIHDIEFIFSKSIRDHIEINPSIISKIPAGESKEITIEIDYEDTEDEIEGKITAFSGDNSDDLKIFISAIENKYNETTNHSTSVKTCSDINARICESDQFCEGSVRYMNSLECCIGSCKEKEDNSSSLALFIIILLVLLGAGYFGYKKVQEKKDKKDYIKSKQSKYRERFKPKETRGNLSRF